MHKHKGNKTKSFHKAPRKSNNVSHFCIKTPSCPSVAPEIQTKARELKRIQWSSSDVEGITIIYWSNRSGTGIPHGALQLLHATKIHQTIPQNLHAERVVHSFLVIWHQSEHAVSTATRNSKMSFFWVFTPCGLAKLSELRINKLSPSSGLKIVLIRESCISEAPISYLALGPLLNPPSLGFSE